MIILGVQMYIANGFSQFNLFTGIFKSITLYYN